MFKNTVLQMGRVKWFDQAAGYGFISPVDGSDEIYVSRRSIANTKNIINSIIIAAISHIFILVFRSIS